MQGMQPGGMQSQRINTDMMQDCHKNMQLVMQTNDEATKDIETAKQSNDPAKMRAALDEAEKALKAVNDHMHTCMSMMNKIQHARHDGRRTEQTTSAAMMRGCDKGLVQQAKHRARTHLVG
jgi:hypothetical protein